MKHGNVIKLFILLTVFSFFNVKLIYADTTCYYTGGTSAIVTISSDGSTVTAKLYAVGENYYENPQTISINNYNKQSTLFVTTYAFPTTTTSYTVNEYTGNGCPEYIVDIVDPNPLGAIDRLYASSNGIVYGYPSGIPNGTLSLNNTTDNAITNKINTHMGTYQPNFDEDAFQNYLYGDTSKLIININPDNSDLSCKIFGEIDDDGSNNEPPSLAYMIHSALSIARIAVIAIVITLGIVDFGKAVISGNEDEMKKNQKRFIKRIIACVIVFLVPLIVDVIMNLIDELAKNLGDQCKDFL